MILIVLLSMSVHDCYIGSKVVVSLFALELGASQGLVGVIAAFYAAVPLLLGVYSGRLADTRGMRSRPHRRLTFPSRAQGDAPAAGSTCRYRRALTPIPVCVARPRASARAS
jgi:hypothetical protein